MENHASDPQAPNSGMQSGVDLRFVTQLTKRTYAIILAGGRGRRLGAPGAGPWG